MLTEVADKEGSRKASLSPVKKRKLEVIIIDDDDEELLKAPKKKKKKLSLQKPTRTVLDDEFPDVKNAGDLDWLMTSSQVIEADKFIEAQGGKVFK